MKTLGWLLSIIATVLTLHVLYIAVYTVSRLHGSLLHLAPIGETIVAVIALDVACIAIWTLVRREAATPL